MYEPIDEYGDRSQRVFFAHGIPRSLTHQRAKQVVAHTSGSEYASDTRSITNSRQLITLR